MCFDDGKLQELIDGVLTKNESIWIKRHLLVCKRCRKIYSELKENEKFVRSKMEKVLQSNQNKKGGFYSMAIKNKKALAAVFIVAIFTVSVIFTPFGKALSNAIKIFRASSVEPIALSISDLQAIESKLQQLDTNSKIDLKQFGNVEYESSNNNRLYIESTTSQDLPKARQTFEKYGINPDKVVDLLQKGNVQSIEINELPNVKLKFKLYVEKVNLLLKSLGSQTFLPQSLDQKEFTLNMEGALNVNLYIKKEENATKKYGGVNYLQIGIAKTPKLQAPVELDEAKLFEAVADLPFLPSNIKSQLNSIKDPTSTLPIPVNINECNYQKINLSGHDGLIVSLKNYPNENYIVWVDSNNDVKYVYSSFVPKDELINFANSIEQR